MQISITQQCPSVHDETLISVHSTAGNWVLVQNESYIHCTNISEKPCSQGGKTQADVKCGTRLMETLCFFRAGCGECRTRRSYSLDRIHVHDSYFLFPFQNIFLRQFFFCQNSFLRESFCCNLSPGK